MQNNRWLQALIILLVIIASAWLAGQLWGFVLQFSSILLLFFLAWLIAFILRPIARWLHKRGMPYTLSVAVVYMGLALILVISGILLVPVISTQIELLNQNATSYTKTIEDLINQGQATLTSWGVQASDLKNISSQLLSQAQNTLLSVLQNTLVLLQSIATLVLQTIFIFLISFYIMKDGDRLSAGMLRLLPPRWEDELRLAALSIERSFGGFIRGQIVFALIYAIFNAVVMVMPPFQLDYVVIASIVAGLCMLIPLMGNFLAYVPAHAGVRGHKTGPVVVADHRAAGCPVHHDERGGTSRHVERDRPPPDLRGGGAAGRGQAAGVGALSSVSRWRGRLT